MIETQINVPVWISGVMHALWLSPSQMTHNQMKFTQVSLNGTVPTVALK